MLFTEREIGHGNRIIFAANSVQFATLPEKVTAAKFLTEIGAATLDQILTMFDMPTSIRRAQTATRRRMTRRRKKTRRPQSRTAEKQRRLNVMGMKQGREYRAVQDFSLVPRTEEKDEYRVRGTAVVFDTPTVLFEYDGVKYSEVIDRNAFDECDMSDVIFNYNHGGKVVARLRNKTLTLTIDERGLHMEADLGGTQAGRELYEEIDGGYVDKMSFSFSVRESKYDSVTHTRTITKVKKLYDVSAVDIPAYKDTEISARSFFEVEHSKELAALEQAARRKRLIALTY